MKLEILPNYPLINTYAPSLYVLYYINDEINNNANYLFRLGYKQTEKIGFVFGIKLLMCFSIAWEHLLSHEKNQT